MNANNNVSLEGAIIECSLETLPASDVQFASMVVSSAYRRLSGNLENSYHRVKFPVSPAMAGNIEKIGADCMENHARVKAGADCMENHARVKAGDATAVKPHFITLDGELKYDGKNQPFILTNEKDLKFPDKVNNKGSHITLDAKIQSILHSSDTAATLLVKPLGEKGESRIPVIIDCERNPIEWSSIVNGKVSEGDFIKVSGRLDGKIYGHEPNKTIMKASVMSESLLIKKNLRRQVKPINQIK